MPDEGRVALEWEATVNTADAERLVQLTDPHVVLVGPRGRVAGHDVLRQWLERARLWSPTRRLFHRDGVVVTDQEAKWHSESGEVIGEAEMASRFVVSDGVVKEYERYDELARALEAAGLTGEDEVDVHQLSEGL